MTPRRLLTYLSRHLQREASLRTPDPPSDSQTATMTSSHTPYMVPTYVRPPPVFVKGEGCRLWDLENRIYLDFTAGIAVNALGHSDPGVAGVLSAQAKTMVHCSNLYHNPWTGLLSKELVQKTHEAGGMRDAARAFICNSGSEANEAAIKFARKFGSQKDSSGQKHKILSFQESFHGRTMGALSATPNPKYQAPFAPMLAGFSYSDYNDVAALEENITEETCGVLVEPIQGEGGVNVATPTFLHTLRRRCDEVGALLIFDEIQCGLGRTGTLWAHCSSDGGVSGEKTGDLPHPDVLTTAKALGNGFPIGAVLVTQRVSDAITTGDHGTTFGGNPMGARAAQHVLARLTSDELRDNVQARSAQILSHLHRLSERFPGAITEIRGRGLIIGAQLPMHEDGSDYAAKVVTAARERGLLIITCGKGALRVVPPLVVSEEEVEEGMGVLGEAFESVFGNGHDRHGVSSEGAVGETKGQQEMGTSR
ncbi:MAG: acetylornithine aminotransferase [Alyxoria varia]|nr:MAG: acetylornithine aminotransferase [Alyxoria varia]